MSNLRQIHRSGSPQPPPPPPLPNPTLRRKFKSNVREHQASEGDEIGLVLLLLQLPLLGSESMNRALRLPFVVSHAASMPLFGAISFFHSSPVLERKRRPPWNCASPLAPSSLFFFFVSLLDKSTVCGYSSFIVYFCNLNSHLPDGFSDIYLDSGFFCFTI